MARSPMMQQYMRIKESYQDAILMFRLGDFYEMFFDDAKTASRVLSLTLTGRDCGEGERAPMCGVPFHAVDGYIGKLVKNGYKVVVCEQMEDPATAKGIVDRDIVRIVTPGTVTDAKQLDPGSNNFICSLYFGGDSVSVCFADVSTGDISATSFRGDDKNGAVTDELGVYCPKELITNADMSGNELLSVYVRERLHAAVYDSQTELYRPENARAAIAKRLPDEEMPDDPGIVCAVGALIGYLEMNLRSESYTVKKLRIYPRGSYLVLDVATRRNLEITETMRDREKKGSLLWVLDHTKSAPGARTLRRWLEMPLVNEKQINRRLDAVSELFGSYVVREEICELEKDVLDLERLLARVEYGSANGKDLRAICATISLIPPIISCISELRSDAFASIREGMDPLGDICSLISSAIKEEPPFSVREGGIIADGYSAEVDSLRSLMNDASGYLSAIEEREKERTGIKNLKIGSNRVFGYYIEVSRSNIGDVPPDYIRKQTLTTGERYITNELKELEGRILGASEKVCALENELFRAVCRKVTEAAPRIRASAAALAELDAYCSLAQVAAKNNYVRPEVTLDDCVIIKNGRHPVVEQFANDGAFVPNDTRLDTKTNRLLIITGPNMAGKSTYMRQIALICLMAQMGSFVPAEDARIGIVDRIFTRVGASDDLASGQSTFMLEMNEVANILKNATKRSLIIYDEIGRGTSTYDGMSIARAVAEYTAGRKLGAKTLFATHYHELTDLADTVEGVVNYNIAARKRGDTIVFLRKIVPGAADDSYGIEVAKLAGISPDVIKRAREVLAELEKGKPTRAEIVAEAKVNASDNMNFDDYITYQIAEKLRQTDIDTITPIEALNLVYELKRMQK